MLFRSALAFRNAIKQAMDNAGRDIAAELEQSLQQLNDKETADD